MKEERRKEERRKGGKEDTKKGKRKRRTINQVSNDDVSEQRRHAKNKTTQEPLMLAYQKFLRETSINCLSERDLRARFSHGVCLTLTIICAAPLSEQRHQLLMYEGRESEDLTRTSEKDTWTSSCSSARILQNAAMHC